jgi:hypothetical protein
VADATEDEDWDLADLGITLHCPACGREMVHDPDSLVLACDRDWALMECGGCAHISKWQWTQDPFEAREVPHGVETVPRRDVH